MNNVEVRALQSNIFQLLAGVPITPSHQLYFNTADERDSYFSGKVIYTFTDMKFMREHRAMKVALNAESLEGANYMRFRNTEYNGVWMYCFIDRIEYVNPNTAYIFFTVDAWQTYFFNVEIRDCDIAREHEASGAAYNANTIPESVDHGDYRLTHEETISLNVGSLDDMGFVIVSTVDLISSGGTTDNPVLFGAPGGRVNNLPSAAGLYYVNGSTSSIDEIMDALSDFPWVAQSIVAIYPFPNAFIPNRGIFESSMGFRIGLSTGGNAQGALQAAVGAVNWMSLFPSFTEKKLYCYPYSFIECVMPDGVKLVLKPELISNSTLTFRISSAIVPDGLLVVRAEGYNGSAEGESNEDWNNNAVTFSGFPAFPVQNDQYFLSRSQAISMNNLTREQAQNKITFDGFMNVANVIGGVSTSYAMGGEDDTNFVSNMVGGAVGAWTSMLSSLFNEHQSAVKSRASIDQMQSAITLSGSSTGAGVSALYMSLYKTLNMHIRFWTIKPEYQTKLQQYFSAFGYASNRIGVPNLNNRPRYNYVKCNSVNIYGNIPNEHLQAIRAMFLNGVTFWHDHDNVGVYGNNG